MAKVGALTGGLGLSALEFGHDGHGNRSGSNGIGMVGISLDSWPKAAALLSAARH